MASGSKGLPQDSLRTSGHELHGRRCESHHACNGWQESTSEVDLKIQTKEKKTWKTNRRPKLPRAKKLRRRRRKERKGGSKQRCYSWNNGNYATLWRSISRTNVSGQDTAAASLYGLRFARPFFQILSKETTAGVKIHGEGEQGEGSKKEHSEAPSKGNESEYTSTYETEDVKRTRRRRQR